jgi:4-amino-4-deoxy-L-arabinose transferase-like glycosyltransferase
VGAPDERQHANYVKHLLEGKGFPVLVPGSPDLGENIENHQPPLYYLLEAGWCKVLGQDPTNPDQGFLPRLLNTLIGVATLYGVYCTAKWGGFDAAVALGATAFAGLLPMSIALHAAVNNDPLLFCMCTWSFAFTIKGLGGDDPRALVLAGVFFGLGLLTKTTALAMVAVFAVTAVVSWRRAGASKAFLWLSMAGLGLLIASPWLVRNLNVYGEPFATKVFMQTFTGNPMTASMVEMMGATNYWLNMFLFWTLRSFVGAFGYSDVFLFEQMGLEKSGALYTAILVVFLIISLGSVLAPRLGQPSKSDHPKPGTTFWAPAVTLLVVILALYLGFNLRYFQAQARYVFPAISVVAVLAAQGMAAWFKGNRAHSWWAWLVILLVLDFVAYGQIVDGFAARMSGLGAS